MLRAGLSGNKLGGFCDGAGGHHSRNMILERSTDSKRSFDHPRRYGPLHWSEHCFSVLGLCDIPLPLAFQNDLLEPHGFRAISFSGSRRSSFDSWKSILPGSYGPGLACPIVPLLHTPLAKYLRARTNLLFGRVFLQAHFRTAVASGVVKVRSLVFRLNS